MCQQGDQLDDSRAGFPAGCGSRLCFPQPGGEQLGHDLVRQTKKVGDVVTAVISELDQRKHGPLMLREHSQPDDGDALGSAVETVALRPAVDPVADGSGPQAVQIGQACQLVS